MGVREGEVLIESYQQIAPNDRLTIEAGGSNAQKSEPSARDFAPSFICARLPYKQAASPVRSPDAA